MSWVTTFRLAGLMALIYYLYQVKNFVVVILFCLWAATVIAQGRDSLAIDKGDLIEDLLFDFYDEYDFNGSVLVAERGEVIYENTFGFSDATQQEPLDADMPFYLASLAKQFTAAAIMQLVEAGKLSLDDPVRKFLPRLPEPYDQVTIYHLLTHTGGVPDYFAAGLARPGITNMDVYKMLVEKGTLDFTPGYKFRYSNSGYVLLAVVIQLVSQKPVEQYFTDAIFKPLGMQHSFVLTPATQYRLRVRGIGKNHKPNDYTLFTIGDGGIYSTARDLFVWQEALNSGKVLSKTSLELMYKPVKLKNGRTRNYGFGWEIGNNTQGPLVYHTGGLAAFRTYIERQLPSGNAIIILTNNSFGEMNELRNWLVKILDNRIASVPLDKR